MDNDDRQIGRRVHTQVGREIAIDFERDNTLHRLRQRPRQRAATGTDLDERL